MPKTKPNYAKMTKEELHDLLVEAARNVLESHCQEGCTPDMTVVNSEPLKRLQDVLHYYANIDAGDDFEGDDDYEGDVE